MKKQIKTVLFALIFVVCFAMVAFVPMTTSDMGKVYAAGETGTAGLAYEYSGYETYYVSKGTATDENIVVPATWDDGTNGEHPVVSVNVNGFKDCTNLKSITLPEGIATIGNYAFNNTSLHNIIIPSTVITIGEYAFYSNPETISYIRFLGNKPTLLGSAANTFPARCLIIVQNAALHVVYSAAWTTYNAWQFVDYETATQNGTLTDDLYIYAQGQYTKHLGNNLNVVIPDTYSYNAGPAQPITQIASYAIYNQRLQSIVMPASMTYIGMYFFAYSSQIANVQTVYFKGTETQFNAITIDSIGNSLANVNVYYYSATEPESDGNFWYDDNGMPTIWGAATEISAAEIVLSQTEFTYDRTSQIPTVTVNLDRAELIYEEDYTLAYENSNTYATTSVLKTQMAGTVTITVIGTGAYAGTATKTYIIRQKELTWRVTAKVNTKIYDGTTSAGLDNSNNVFLDGGISGDGISKTLGSVAFASPNAGDSVAVVAQGYSFSGFPGMASNYHMAGQPVFANAKISPRGLIISPDAKSKQYGASDPEFTFNRQVIEDVISGYNTISGNTDSLSGSLGRESGEAIGSYNYTVGTLSAGTNYAFSMQVDNKFTITQAAGASATVPTLDRKTHNSINVNAVANAANGQAFEYGIADSPAGGPEWQADTLFSDLIASTTYYIYARAMESTNYFAGIMSAALVVNTNAAPVPPTITTTGLHGGTVGIAYSQTLAATGDAPITWSLTNGSLPNGLALGTDGGITGTPLKAGTFTFSVKATNAIGNAIQQLSIVIEKGAGAAVSAPTTLNISGNSISVNTLATLSNGQTVEYAISLINSSTDIADDSWQDSTVFTELVSNTMYYIFARAKANDDYNVGGTSTALTATTLNPQPPIITTTSLTDGTAGVSYSQALEATGDYPITWTMLSGNLPIGLTLNSNGTILGTPIVAGTFTFTLKVENGVNPSSTKELSITVAVGTGASVTTPSTYNATEKTKNSITIPALSALENGQIIEFAISTTNSANGLVWQDGTTFSGLDADTTYYVFARAKANSNYNAGTASMVLEVKTDDATNDGNPAGLIIGIIVGVIVLLGGGFALYWFAIRKKKTA